MFVHGVYQPVGTYSRTYTYIKVGRVGKITENIYDATGKLFLIFRYHFLIQHINWNCMSLSDFAVLRLPLYHKRKFCNFCGISFYKYETQTNFCKTYFYRWKSFKNSGAKTHAKISRFNVINFAVFFINSSYQAPTYTSGRHEKLSYASKIGNCSVFAQFIFADHEKHFAEFILRNVSKFAKIHLTQCTNFVYSRKNLISLDIPNLSKLCAFCLRSYVTVRSFSECSHLYVLQICSFLSKFSQVLRNHNLSCKCVQKTKKTVANMSAF